MGVPMGILRAFLGGTFVFAGIQKLIDPNFLRRGSPDYIGTQLTGFAKGTPLGPVFAGLAHHALLVGISTALFETAIGLAVLAGVLLPLAALGGFVVNLSLFLSATWHVRPYFLGSDSIYAVAWLVLAIATWSRWTRRPVPGRGGRVTWVDAGPSVERRAALQAGMVGAIAIALDVVARTFRGSSATVDGIAGLGQRHPSTGAPPTEGPSTGSTAPPTTQTPPPANGTMLTTLDQLPVGRAVGFQAPGVGSAVLLRLANDRVLAYSRICTHAGCLVGYDSSAQLLICPCHGAEFDPSRGAEPIAGPASSPLEAVRVIVDSSGRVVLPG